MKLNKEYPVADSGIGWNFGFVSLYLNLFRRFRMGSNHKSLRENIPIALAPRATLSTARLNSFAELNFSFTKRPVLRRGVPS